MKSYIREIPKASDDRITEKNYQVVIVGGGMSGLCAAIASARHGAKTALIHDRSVYGGNASSETRMHISGASCHWGKKNSAETGILMELQLENKYLNDSYNYSIWDGVLWSAAENTENLDCYMNTAMYHADSDGSHIKSISCFQMNTEKHFHFTGSIYIDATGNGTLGYFAGAEYMIGREAKSDYGEPDAPDQRDGNTMGNTIYFVAEDRGRPIVFHKPSWAFTFDDSWFKYRYHGDIVVYHDADEVVMLKPDEDYADHADQLVEKYDVKSGYWWIELGGDYDDIIAQNEQIRYELYRCVYGVWDHIKNGGDHGAENYELTWVGNVSGTRESRRLLGDYVLTENDITEKRFHEDAVAYGGWPMDEHTAGGFKAKGQVPSHVRSFPGLYTIPYGCYCSKTIDNLMMAGRDISCTKLAIGSIRVMGTCAIGGQAAGTAAALAAALGLLPREYGYSHIHELQQTLLRDDCYIPGVINEDPLDLARVVKVHATSERPGCGADKVINGIARNTNTNATSSSSGADNAETAIVEQNLWCSDGLHPEGEILTLKLPTLASIQEIRLTLDPDLSEERCISVSKAFIEKEPRGVAPTLLKDFDVIICKDGQPVRSLSVQNNYQCLIVLPVSSPAVGSDPVCGDEVRIHIFSTNGCPDAHIFEVRIY